MIFSPPAPQFGLCCMPMSKTRWSSRPQLMWFGRARRLWTSHSAAGRRLQGDEFKAVDVAAGSRHACRVTRFAADQSFIPASQ